MAKEYKNFEEFYHYTSNFVKQFDRIEDVRKCYSKNILHCYYCYNGLDKTSKTLLNSNTNKVKLSLDNLVKNRIHHREITLKDYIRIQDIIKHPAMISKAKNDSDIILFEDKSKYFMLVIKTTKNKDENFIKSFRLLGKDEYEKYKKNSLTGWT